MLIYRIEHSTTREGPYVGPGCIRGLKVMVEPEKDGIGEVFGRIFGCISLEILCEWFCDAWRDLEQEGYTLAVYQVKDTSCLSIGRKQCAFYKNSVELIETQRVFNIFNCFD